MRGEYPTRLSALAVTAELPPRARRIQAIRDGADINQGTTSAYAENTRGRLPPPYQKWNYLSVHGEYLAIFLIVMNNKELPPRARRILRAIRHQPFWPGTTSACAENTVRCGQPPPAGRNYLRVRGEYRGVFPYFGEVAELPPRARRIPPNPSRTARTCGTTSACAENTALTHHETNRLRNYLRVRGEYIKHPCDHKHNRELPPRARRIRRLSRTARRTLGTTSACAENT